MIVVSMLLKDPMTGSMEPRRFRVSSFGGYVYDVDTGRQVSEQLSGMGVMLMCSPDEASLLRAVRRAQRRRLSAHRRAVRGAR